MNITERIYSCWSVGLTVMLAVATLLLGGCRSEQPTPDEDRVLLLRMTEASPMRSVDGVTGGLTAEYRGITLFFWTEGDKPVEPYRMTFSKKDNPQEMARLISAQGLSIKVKSRVGKVSAICNVSEPAKTNVLDIQRTDEWVEEANPYLNQVPYEAKKAAVTTTSDPNRLTVTLEPKPRMARLEISGFPALPIESTLNKCKHIDAATTGERRLLNEGLKRACISGVNQTFYVLDSMSVTGIYVNNYVQDVNTPTVRTFFGPGDYNLAEKWFKNSSTQTLWGAHPVQMHDMFPPTGDHSYASSVFGEDKVAGYQIWVPEPGVGQETTDHVIIQVRYRIWANRPLEGEDMVKNPDLSSHQWYPRFLDPYRDDWSGSRYIHNPRPDFRFPGCIGMMGRFPGFYYCDVDRFITIRHFKSSTGGPVTHFKPGFVYRIDLSELSPLFDIWQRDENGDLKKVRFINKDGEEDYYPLNKRERTDRRPEEDGVEVPVLIDRWSEVGIDYDENHPLY